MPCNTQVRADGKLLQHLIDPATCTACRSCEAICPNGAIFERDRVVGIDPSLCEDCGDCISECATGAIESWRLVEAAHPYSLEEQFAWTSLPPEELL
jgi:benzoyl-CoA 2,3-dioxygenase component A